MKRFGEAITHKHTQLCLNSSTNLWGIFVLTSGGKVDRSIDVYSIFLSLSFFPFKSPHRNPQMNQNYSPYNTNNNIKTTTTPVPCLVRKQQQQHSNTKNETGLSLDLFQYRLVLHEYLAHPPISALHSPGLRLSWKPLSTHLTWTMLNKQSPMEPRNGLAKLHAQVRWNAQQQQRRQ